MVTLPAVATVFRAVHTTIVPAFLAISVTRGVDRRVVPTCTTLPAPERFSCVVMDWADFFRSFIVKVFTGAAGVAGAVGVTALPACDAGDVPCWLVAVTVRCSWCRPSGW